MSTKSIISFSRLLSCIILLISSKITISTAFSSLPLLSSPSSLLLPSRLVLLQPRIKTSLFATKNNKEDVTSSSKLYPPMSRDEVQAFLDTVPVYTVTEPSQGDNGLVLLKEQNNPKEIAYFFFSPEAANKVFAPLRRNKNSGSNDDDDDFNWNVSAYPLGLVWFELINAKSSSSSSDNGVEYRLLPAREDLMGAQKLLQEQAKQQGKSSKDVDELGLFKSSYNEIPIFVDQYLRITAAIPNNDATTTGGGEEIEREERVPMYVGLEDLTETCNQAIKASSGQYQAAMSVISLNDLINEMMKVGGNVNDYRKAVLIPPTTGTQNQNEVVRNDTTDDSSLTWGGKQDTYNEGVNTNTKDMSIPTATNDWSD